MPLLTFLARVVERDNLSSEDAELAMSAILAGEASTAQIAAFLVGLRMKGETPDELVGLARAMRAKAAPVDAGGAYPLVDTCGTGGDGSGTFNISTTAAFVVAGAGVSVAKHGNRSISSQCGSADLFEALGVRIPMQTEHMGRCIREAGIGFLFAPAIHPAMKHAQPARLELKLRTVFNLLGPLTNPAGASAQVVGAPSERAAELMAEALSRLGLQRGFVVHGSDGLDEVTTTGPTLALEVRAGSVTRTTLTPEAFGVPRALREQLIGGGREQNASVTRSVLAGSAGPQRDIVLVNAATALVAAGRADGFREGVRLAADSIDSGSASSALDRLVQLCAEF